MGCFSCVANKWDSLANQYTYFPKIETVKKGLASTVGIIIALALVILPAVGIVIAVKALSVHVVWKWIIGAGLLDTYFKLYKAILAEKRRQTN